MLTSEEQGQPNVIRFVARTIPVAKARHRSFVKTSRNGKLYAGTYAPSENAKAESEFIALAEPHAPPRPFDGPLEISLIFYLPIATSSPAWWKHAAAIGRAHHCKKPDVDNLAKLVLDAMTRSGQWWRDDTQIVSLHAHKRYGDTPETAVEVTPLQSISRNTRAPMPGQEVLL